MKTRRYVCAIIVSLCVLVLLTFLNLSPYTPAGAIRLHALRISGPLDALVARVQRTGFHDSVLGEQFIVEGVIDRETGQELRFFYVRKESRGRWRVTVAGTGP